MPTLDGNTKILLSVSELPCILSLIQYILKKTRGAVMCKAMEDIVAYTELTMEEIKR